MSYDETKPSCARCNPRPPPSINIDECPNCEKETRLSIWTTLQEQFQHGASQGQLGRDAIQRLMPVLAGRSGQCFKLRGILYSLWNGQPYSLVEVVNLDWEIKQNLSVVMASWGYPGCFYDDLRDAIVKTGQWPWFLEQEEEVIHMRQYVEAYDRRKEAR